MAAIETFGEFELELSSSLLRRAGVPIAAGQRALALLSALVRAGGRVVSKPELMNAAWPNLYVEEANLTVQISKLRRLLGRRTDGAEWIVTVPGLGYRFTPEKAVTATFPDSPGVAVLPFHHEESEPELRQLASGIVADLIAALSRFRSLQVVSRSISLTYAGRTIGSKEAARELGVGYVLEGTLQRHGPRLRTTVQLVEGATGAVVWAEQINGTVDDTFELQDRIVGSVAVRIEPSINASELVRVRHRGLAKSGGYSVYLRALSELTDESEPANRRAVGMLQLALAEDPDNPVLLSQAAWALEHRHTMGWAPLTGDDVELCLRYARRALQHANGDAAVMAQCGMALLQAGRDYSSGLAVIRAALAANSNGLMMLASAGVAEIHCGNLDDAERHLRRMLALSPLDPDNRFSLTGLAMVAIIRGDYQQALVHAGHSLAVNRHFDATYWMLIAANAHLGRMENAHRHLAALRRLVPGVTITRIRAGQPDMLPDRIGPILEGLRLAGLAE